MDIKEASNILQKLEQILTSKAPTDSLLSTAIKNTFLNKRSSLIKILMTDYLTFIDDDGSVKSKSSSCLKFINSLISSEYKALQEANALHFIGKARNLSFEDCKGMFTQSKLILKHKGQNTQISFKEAGKLLSGEQLIERFDGSIVKKKNSKAFEIAMITIKKDKVLSYISNIKNEKIQLEQIFLEKYELKDRIEFLNERIKAGFIGVFLPDPRIIPFNQWIKDYKLFNKFNNSLGSLIAVNYKRQIIVYKQNASFGEIPSILLLMEMRIRELESYLEGEHKFIECNSVFVERGQVIYSENGFIRPTYINKAKSAKVFSQDEFFKRIRNNFHNEQTQLGKNKNNIISKHLQSQKKNVISTNEFIKKIKNSAFKKYCLTNRRTTQLIQLDSTWNSYC